MNDPVPTLPEVSVAVQVTDVTPTGNNDPEDGVHVGVILIPVSSLTVAIS